MPRNIPQGVGKPIGLTQGVQRKRQVLLNTGEDALHSLIGGDALDVHPLVLTIG